MAAPVSATGAFNDAYAAELYEAYQRDPASVDTAWREFFALAEKLTGGDGAARPYHDDAAASVDGSLLRIAAGAAALTQAIRVYGHYAVQLDPLGTSPQGAPELTPEFHRITEADLDLVPGAAVGFPHMATAADVVRRLRLRYSTALGIEVTHLSEEEERKWFRQILTAEELTRPLTPDEKRVVLHRLTQVDSLERFIGRAYPNAKRFSIEGNDALVPMIDAAIDESAGAGARHVAIAMAHRGRLNVLAHILNKPYANIFEEFDGHAPDGSAEHASGDVKYHLGASATRTTSNGSTVEITLLPNPSHLEFVNPVLEGYARALECPATNGSTPNIEPTRVLPVCVHGDAAFPGEGVVAETLNLSRLPGYEVGGTLHIIVNNQIGFTTDSGDSRSTYYASDIAKGFNIPVIHVNADNAEACIIAVRVAVAYRAAFKKDFVIDVVGYRRHGHNEGDEPAFTQPALTAKIKAHPSARVVWGERLVREGVISAADVDADEHTVMDAMAQEHAKLSDNAAVVAHDPPRTPTARPDRPLATSVSVESLTALNAQLLAWPEGFAVHPRLARQLARRKDAVAPESSNIDWGFAESLAFASLLTEGTPIRLSGQDAERGTFSQRHAVLHDVNTGATYTPLQHLAGGATFEVHNSPLTETAVLGFEYGYSTAAPDTLVLWEAQYGDFVNVAQPMIDQFIVADRTKWEQDSGIVMLLPHGYEGGGPEHSSARLERFLQLCAEGDLTVTYPTTAAQYFHMLRRQARSSPRRPLIVMTPKSLLRLDRAASSVQELSIGHFQSVIDDPNFASATPEQLKAVKRVLFCTGKIYYDLTAGAPMAETVVVRVEELYPWPHEAITWIMKRYPSVTEVLWVQEEPRNMGAWTFAAPRLRPSIANSIPLRYVGRPERASPSEGYLASHNQEQTRIVNEARCQPAKS